MIIYRTTTVVGATKPNRSRRFLFGKTTTRERTKTMVLLATAATSSIMDGSSTTTGAGAATAFVIPCTSTITRPSCSPPRTAFHRLYTTTTNTTVLQETNVFTTNPIFSSVEYTEDTNHKNHEEYTPSSTSRTPSAILFESNGDYRTEGWIEKIELPLYKEQNALPSLPIPTLEETVQTFLPTALPLAENSNEVIELMNACNNFPKQAALLQQRLLERNNEYKSNSSWLQQWWNQYIYLRWREPNAMHVSYFFQLPDDPVLPTDHYNHNKSNKRYNNNNNQLLKDNNNEQQQQHHFGLQRAASALQAVALYGQMVIDGTHPTDMTGHRGQEHPLCSSQYKMLFGACRIPQPNQDNYRVYDLTNSNNKPLHAVVAVKGQFYKIPLTSIDDNNHNKKAVLSRSTIQNLLQQCLDHKVTNTIPELGYLTSTHRDTWASVYPLFLQTKEMADALNELQSSLCMICLDFDEGQKLLNERDFALRLWHGNGVHSSNRWYDKSIQLVFSKNGNMGLIGEHSMADGMPAMGLCNYLRKRANLNYENDPNQQPIQPVEKENIAPIDGKLLSPPVMPIFEAAFHAAPKQIQQELEKHVEDAKQHLMDRIDKHDLQVLFYSKCGKKAIKQYGHSPDAFVQTAMQLAASRIFNNGQKLVGVYEATQTRKFRHGRTETTRSVSPECDAFCRAMNTNNQFCSNEEKIELLQKACQVHSNYIAKAVDGKGVDRHFFGLQMCVQENDDDDKIPDLFTNPVFQRSKKWLLSTSTVPGCAPGFGNVEPDGVGIGYEILDDTCIFTITGEKRTECANKVRQHLQEALDEMSNLHNDKNNSARSDQIARL